MLYNTKKEVRLMVSEVNKYKVISSLIWKLMERGGAQIIQFTVQIVLARLLLPEDFGLIAIVTVFTILANVFVQSGFNTALIQSKKANAIDFSSVFYLSIFVAGLLYMLLYIFSPFIAEFYNIPELTLILRVLSFTLFFGAFNSIQNAVIARNMMYKMLFFSSLGAITVSGTIGIVMAYIGFGVWALVTQQLINQFLITIILWFTVKWRPKLLFSPKRLKGLFSFGWKLLVSSLIDSLYSNVRGLLIGKIYNPSQLGFYNRGQQFPSIIVSNIDSSIQSVMFTALSTHQDNRARVKDMVRRSIVTSSFIVLPLMVGLAAVAKPLVEILLTEKWLPAVPFLQILCFSYALWPIHTSNLQAINALGRSDIFLRLEIIKKIIGLVILLISIPFGIYVMVFGEVLVGIISTFINAYPNFKLLNYSYKEQWKDILPSLIISIVMGTIIYSFQWIGMNAGLTIIIQVVVGVLIYISLAYIFKLECFKYLLLTGKDFIRSKKGVV